MPATHMNRISIHGWLLPLVAVAAGLALGKSEDWITGAALAVLLIGSVTVAVHHAELVALWLGEPYGTLVLTLAVTIIELSLIVSLMLTGDPNPSLVRDTVLAVVMLVLNGLAGICIVAGTLRHREQEYRTLGANAFLAVLMPMAVLVLVLPNYFGDTGAVLLETATDVRRQHLPGALPGVSVRADGASPGLLRADGTCRG
jgi:Ca2+:H+ antiporter